MTTIEQPERDDDIVTERDKAMISAVRQYVEGQVAPLRATADTLERELKAGVRDVQSLVASTDATLRRIEEERLRLTAVNVARMAVVTANVGEWLDRCALPPEFAPSTAET